MIDNRADLISELSQKCAADASLARKEESEILSEFSARFDQRLGITIAENNTQSAPEFITSDDPVQAKPAAKIPALDDETRAELRQSIDQKADHLPKVSDSVPVDDRLAPDDSASEDENRIALQSEAEDRKDQDSKSERKQSHLTPDEEDRISEILTEALSGRPKKPIEIEAEKLAPPSIADSIPDEAGEELSIPTAAKPEKETDGKPGVPATKTVAAESSPAKISEPSSEVHVSSESLNEYRRPRMTIELAIEAIAREEAAGTPFSEHSDAPEFPGCLIPWFDGAILSQEWKEALWDKFVTGAPRPRTPSERR